MWQYKGGGQLLMPSELGLEALAIWSEQWKGKGLALAWQKRKLVGDRSAVFICEGGGASVQF